MYVSNIVLHATHHLSKDRHTRVAENIGWLYKVLVASKLSMTQIHTIFICGLHVRVMYFLFLDGSGQTKIKHSSQDNGMYVLSGVLVHEKDWKSIEKRLDEAKQELLPKIPPHRWEFHAQDIWNDKEFFAKEGLSLAKKEEIFSKVVDLACKSEITIISVIIFKDRLKRRYSSEVMKQSWTLLVGGFERFLKQKPIQTNNGLLFMDSSQKAPDAEIMNVVRRLVGGSSKRRDIHHTIENPIFVESHMWNLIQLADMIAYVIHRHYNEDPRFKKWFELLEPKMYHSGGKLYGFGIKELPNLNNVGKQVRTHAERLLP